MWRYAGSRDKRTSRRRLMAGAATAVAVTFTFVGANALWYQPHAHQSPILATRLSEPMEERVPEHRKASDQDAVETIIRLEAEQPTPPAPRPRMTERRPETTGQGMRAPEESPVHEVQRMMADLGLYEGEIDGIAGPMTESAVKAYQEMIGIERTGEIEGKLLTRLGLDDQSAVPVPAPRPRSEGTDAMRTSAVAEQGGSRIERIQAGLRAFGNDGIEEDGIVGPRTREAILEFQSLFGLPETGEPDTELYAKMSEIGLIN